MRSISSIKIQSQLNNEHPTSMSKWTFTKWKPWAHLKSHQSNLEHGSDSNLISMLIKWKKNNVLKLESIFGLHIWSLSLACEVHSLEQFKAKVNQGGKKSCLIYFKVGDLHQNQSTVDQRELSLCSAEVFSLCFFLVGQWNINKS